MQTPPLLERLDWVFTSCNWDLSFPSTSCKTLTMEVSDHCPLVISISTNLPKAHTFIFENFWILRPGFQALIADNWPIDASHVDKAQSISRKFKRQRATLRAWNSSFSNLKTTIDNISLTINFMEVLEEYRDLSLEEWNFRIILREKLLSLLAQ